MYLNDTLFKKCFEALKTILQSLVLHVCVLKVIVKPEAHSGRGIHHVTSIEQYLSIDSKFDI